MKTRTWILFLLGSCLCFPCNFADAFYVINEPSAIKNGKIKINKLRIEMRMPTKTVSKKLVIKKLPNRGYLSGERSKNGKFGSIISSASKHYGLEVALLRAVIKAESNFDPRAISRRGARGLMQLMPGTAREMGVSNIHDPTQNIHGGAKYLAIQLKKFRRKDLALAAYNSGPENVKKGRFPKEEETRDYVKKVIFYEKLYASS